METLAWTSLSLMLLALSAVMIDIYWFNGELRKKFLNWLEQRKVNQAEKPEKQSVSLQDLKGLLVEILEVLKK